MSMVPDANGPVRPEWSALWVNLGVDTRDQPTLTLPDSQRYTPELPTLKLPGGVRVTVHLFTDHDEAADWWTDLSAAAMTAAHWHRERPGRQQ